MKRRPDAQLIAVLAARGSGKSAWLAQWMQANPHPRRVVWDTKREHGIKGTSNLAEAIRLMPRQLRSIACGLQHKTQNCFFHEQDRQPHSDGTEAHQHGEG